jgi:hypothetical protein
MRIDAWGATGEYKSGKTILGLSIAPGVHPEGHPFAGQPRTLYLDFEKSGATYGGTGCKRVDVPSEMLARKGNKYTPKDTAEWFLEYISKLKPRQFDVLMVDPATDVESGIVDIVRGDPAAHGYTAPQFAKSPPLLMGAVKAFWKQILLKLSNVCQTFYFTAHLRDEFAGNTPTGRREPKGKDSLLEVATLYVWLERKTKDGKTQDAPSALCEEPHGKSRLADTWIENGELKVQQLLPPRIPVMTMRALCEYIASPPDFSKLKEGEKIVDVAFSEADMERLKIQRAQAEADAANARLSLVDRQQQLTAIRAAAAAGQPQTPDRTAQQSAAEKRQAEGEVARQANAEAQAKLDAAKAEGERLLAAAQGDHATARDVAKEVQEKKTAATTPQPSDGSTERINLFKSLLGQVGYLTDPIVKQNVDNAIQIRGHSKFSQLDAEDQTAINAWLSDLMDCRLFATQLGLDDAKLEGMLSRASIKRIEHLGGALAVTLRDKLKQAITARATAGQSGQAGQSGN